jgi:hypothetical protein
MSLVMSEFTSAEGKALVDRRNTDAYDNDAVY